MRSVDPFSSLHEATRRHRADHGCGAYTYADGSLLGVVAGVARATRVVEVGTALGYTAAWLAHGASEAHIDTIEADQVHVDLARQHLASAGLDARVTVHHGDADEVIATLSRHPGTYDVAFFDGYTPTQQTLDGLRQHLRVGGVLIAANMTLGPNTAVTSDLRDPKRWMSHELGETFLCVKVGP